MNNPIPRILAIAALLLPLLANTQSITFPIDIHNGQQIETCSGFFTDSGGDTLTPYGNNEQYSVTFTAQNDDGDTPLYMKLRFDFFELGASDYLYVYDGESDDDPLIIMAGGDDLQDEEIWASGGSLHLRFESSPSDTARGWWASISCFELCDAFFVDVDTQSGSFDFCPDVQNISFTASGGYYGGEPGDFANNITYNWNFDGIHKEGESVTHQYDGSGAYPFSLSVEDPLNGCTFDTIITVRIATTPNFNDTQASSDTVCARETFTLAGNVNIISWTGFPTSVDTVAFINDEEPFSSSLHFDVFPDEQQIVFTEDFDRVCIDIEHTNYGHLRFELECPNGTSVVLKDFSPGGAHLGEPVVFGNNDIPGIGYEYCFGTAPQLGTMEETSFQFYDYTDQAGDVYFNQPFMPPGIYTPDEPLNDFIGCPLNGQWTVTVEDDITGTSGHVMGWSMFFNDDFYPDSLIFTPEVVEEKWFDNMGNEIGDNPASTELEEEGAYEFTYVVTDNFGCSWDTTLTVTALPLPEAEIVSELEIPVCEGDSTLFTVVPDFEGDQQHWLYQWMMEGAELEEQTEDTIMAKELATYMVRVTDTITGCFDFFDLTLTDQNCDLEIPNVFTPNGDGVNDVFEIENLEHYPGSTIVIYNRHGRKVFEHNDYYLNWWDGGNQPDGTYYYVLTYMRQGEKKDTHGIITIIR